MGGRLSDRGDAHLGAVALLVDDGRRVYRREALSPGGSGRTEAEWHAAFPVPRRWLDSGQTRWALDAGEILALPTPAEREPRARGRGRTRARPGAGRRSSALLLASVAAIGVVGVAVAAGMSADRGESTAGSRPVELRALAAARPGASGRVSRAGDRALRLHVAGLQPGRRYTAWVYRSPRDATPLGSLRGPSATVFLRAPTRIEPSTWFDVSVGGQDRTEHSGRSVLRAPMSALEER